jgi:hypothetical protein
MDVKIIILIFILFIFYLIFIFYKNIKETYIKKVIDLKFWKNKYSDCHEELLEFINQVIPYFKKWNVTYWAHAGTLLGCVRHSGIIPWDDDVDFGYIDNGNIENLIQDLENNNFNIDYKILGIKVNTMIGFHILNKNNYCIDI